MCDIDESNIVFEKKLSCNTEQNYPNEFIDKE